MAYRFGANTPGSSTYHYSRKRKSYRTRPDVHRSRYGRKYRKGTGIPFRMRGYVRNVGYYKRFTGRSGEMKFHDVDINDAVIDTAGSIQTELLAIAEGNGEEQRVGRKITIKSIHWRFAVVLTSLDGVTAPTPGDVSRLILYQDTQTNGAAAAVTDILEAADYQSFLNLANSQRFRILFDRSYTTSHKAAVGTPADGDYAGEYVAGQFHKKCSIPIEYDNSATTGAIATIRSNNIGALFISANGDTGVGSKIRFRFTDH